MNKTTLTEKECESTGLRDFNGTEIFAGDEVSYACGFSPLNASRRAVVTKVEGGFSPFVKNDGSPAVRPENCFVLK